MKRRRSALESYDGCPYRYNQLYNLGIEDRGDESQRGIAFHEAAFRYIARLMAKRLTADAAEARAAFIEGVALTQLPAHIVHEVARIWERFAEYFELDLDAYMAAEEMQETERFTCMINTPPPTTPHPPRRGQPHLRHCLGRGGMCGALVTHGRCRDCARAHDTKRGTRHERGYDARWERARRAHLASYPLCGQRPNDEKPVMSRCAHEQRATPARVVDHVVPHRGDMVLFWDSDNWQSLCEPCHYRKTAAGL